MGVRAINLRKGMGVRRDNQLWMVVSSEKVAKGNWRSYMQIELKNVNTGQIIKDRFRVDEELEETFFDRKKMEFLYRNGADLVVMDPVSYEQVEIPVELVGDKIVFLVENTELDIAFVEGKAVTIDLPNTVVLTVTDTPPQVRSATATSQLKEAVCDTGAKIKVPPFVENGQKVNVDTRTGEYLGRA